MVPVYKIFILYCYESYAGKWSAGAGYTAAYENPESRGGKELACSISNDSEFSGSYEMTIRE